MKDSFTIQKVLIQFHFLVDVLKLLGNFEEIVRCYDQLLNLEPTNFETQLLKSYISTYFRSSITKTKDKLKSLNLSHTWHLKSI